MKGPPFGPHPGDGAGTQPGGRGKGHPDLYPSPGTHEEGNPLHHLRHFLIILSAIDNLVKGASGQAVQNMNVMLGLEESLGLDIIPVYP